MGGVWWVPLALLATLVAPFGAPAEDPAYPVVFSQSSGGRSRLVRLNPDGSLLLLSDAFLDAADPDVSFDGQRIVFAARRNTSSRWQIYEMDAQGSSVRQLTAEEMDCRHPIYQSKLYVITSDEPWYQVAFEGTPPGRNSSLYTVRLDGTGLSRITFNPYDDADPFVMPDGRILLASRQGQRMALFGVNSDGTDYAAFSGEQGAAWQGAPCVTSNRLAVFVENDEPAADGGGWLASVTLRRNLHSYRRLTSPADGTFHSPSPLPDGRVLVGHRPPGAAGYGLWRFDPVSGAREPFYDDPAWDDVQAKLLAPRPEPDGRSSVVNESDRSGLLYCLNVYVSRLSGEEALAPGSVKRVRVLESALAGGDPTAVLQVHTLGEADVEPDGSFHIRVPANTPIRLQLLDTQGKGPSCGWIWVRNAEPRGCIGCHEDGELTPENRMVDAVVRPATNLFSPPPGGAPADEGAHER